MTPPPDPTDASGVSHPDRSTDGATELERRLIAAFGDARTTITEHPDLFARVHHSLAESRARRRFRLRLAALIGAFVIANTALAVSLSLIAGGQTTGPDNRRFTMPWWVIELITDIVLVALAIGLGPFIKRFGRAYAADVFRSNPRTGKSYLVLTDVAYYLIFTAFILFTVTFVAPDDWKDSPGVQLKVEVARIGGILLIMGVLHTLNVVALPVIGGLLNNNTHLAQKVTAPPSPPPTPSAGTTAGGMPLGPGTWILRVEAAPTPPPVPPTPGIPPTAGPDGQEG